MFHIWAAPSFFRFSVGAFSEKPTFVVKLKQLRFSNGLAGNAQAKRFCVGNIKTKTSFCG